MWMESMRSMTHEIAELRLQVMRLTQESTAVKQTASALERSFDDLTGKYEQLREKVFSENE